MGTGALKHGVWTCYIVRTDSSFVNSPCNDRSDHGEATSIALGTMDPKVWGNTCGQSRCGVVVAFSGLDPCC